MKKNNMMRFGALALSLFVGAAMVVAPASTASAKSIQRDGYFGGTWSPIGPRNNRYTKRYHRNHYSRGYYGPRYGYYGPRYGYYGPRYYDRGPGFSITIR